MHPAHATCVPSIESDLSALLGHDWTDRIAATPATEVYCDRLNEVCRSWPGGFVAHHYTRYLGDLSGGQFIGRVVRRVFDIDATSGAAFFDFPGIADATSLKDGYRERLDTAAWDDAERSRIIDEIRRAYRLNTDVLDSLGSAMIWVRPAGQRTEPRCR